jgi:3-phosphoglycerate kinase
MESFANGTIELGKYSSFTQKEPLWVVTLVAVKQFGLEIQMSYVSTGGGAMLECLRVYYQESQRFRLDISLLTILLKFL